MVELTAIRFFAAVSVMFVHMPGALEGHPAVPDALVALGHRGVDLFFVLSGFIIMHAYGARPEPLRLGPYLQNRMARVYPLHLFTCLVFIFLFARPTDGGVAAVNWNAAIWHLTALHSTGIVEAHALNFPSWSVSAELLAYLTFPAALWWARRCSAPVALGTAVLALILTDRVVAARGADLFTLTNDGGVLRAVLGFWVGVGLYRLFQVAQPDGHRARWLMPVAVAAAVASAVLGAPGAITVLLLTWVVYLCAALSCDPRPNPMRAPVLIWLGKRSYAFYMAHLFVIILIHYLFHRAGLEWMHWSSVVACIVTTIAVSDLLYRGVEEPARRRFRAGGPGLRHAARTGGPLNTRPETSA